MIVSIPIETNSHFCDGDEDERTLDDLIAEYGDTHTIDKGMKITDYEKKNVYEYSLSKKIYVKPYDKTNVKAHKKGDVVTKNGHHYLIVKADVTTGSKWQYQPEEYPNVETKLSNFASWTGRYFRVPLVSGGGGEKYWTFGNRTYYIQDTKVCGYNWRIRDNVATGKTAHNKANSEWCLRNSFSDKFSYSKDLKAVKKMWHGRNGISELTLFIKSFVRRGEYMYIRTWCDVKVEKGSIAPTVKYEIRRIQSPSEIEGFRFHGITNLFSVFDNKNYTKGIFSPSTERVSFSFITTEYSDTISLGRVIGDSVSVEVRDDNGSIISSINKYPIDNSISDTDISQSANVILYTNSIIPPTSKVTVIVHGAYISIGRILAGRKVKLGFTNTLFQHGFRDFSPKEQDQWGNIEYKNGVRVYTHNGTVDLPLSSYDALIRACMYIGAEEMIINSSDSIDNTPSNSITIFQSTMLIGRFTAIKPKTNNVGNLIDSVATFTFSIEESV